MSQFGSPPGDVQFPVIPESPFGLPPFHQVAIFMPTRQRVDAAVDMMKLLGVDEWHHDEPLYKGLVFDRRVECYGYLRFNYQILGGFELEFLTHEGESPWLEWSRKIGGVAFVSHMSCYVNNVYETAEQLRPHIGAPYYIRETHDHINDHVKGIKRFREYIYNTRDTMGFDVKTIQRIPHGDG